MRYLWRGLLLLALGGLGWGAWFLVAHPHWGEAPPPQAPAALAVRAPSLTVFGWQRRGGRAEKLWQVTAHDVRASADGHAQWFQQITDGILYHDGQPIARFSAGQGQGDESQNTLSIHGGAHLRLEGDGTAVDTEEVDWQGPKRQLWLPRPIRLTRAGLRLEGARAHLDQKAGRLTAEYVTGRTLQFGFQAHHGTLLFKGRRLELSPVVLDLPGGHGHAARVVYYAEEGRYTAQEVQMQLPISPTAGRAAAATRLTLALLHAAGAAPGVASKTIEPKTHQVTIQADDFTGTDKVQEYKHAVVHDGDTTFTADHVHVEKDEAGRVKLMIATGNPRGWNERDEVVGDKMTVYPTEHRAVVEGHFRVTVKPQPGDAPSENPNDLRSQLKDGVMTGDRLEYDYRSKNVAAEGNLKMVSRGRTVTGQKLFYTDSSGEVQFFGPVHAHDPKQGTFDTATGLTLSLKKDGISHVPGKFTAVLYVQDDEEPTAPTGGEGPADKASTPRTESSAAPKAAPHPGGAAPATPPTPDQKAP